MGALALFLHQYAQCYTRPTGDTPASPISRQAEGLSLRRWLVLVGPVVRFWWMWFQAVENTACPAIRAKALAPSELSCQQPAPVLDLLNMFPRPGTKDQMWLVTLEGKPAVCIPRGLGLSSFPPSQALHPLSTGSTQFLSTLQRPKKDCRVPNVQFYGMKTLGRGNNNKVNATLPFLCGYVIRGQAALSGRAGRRLGGQRCTLHALKGWWGGSPLPAVRRL